MNKKDEKFPKELAPEEYASPEGFVAKKDLKKALGDMELIAYLDGLVGDGIDQPYDEKSFLYGHGKALQDIKDKLL